jgi:hypothetical protein
MAVLELEQGVEIWGDVAEMLNDIYNADGKIDKDDKRIWGPYLHTWTNEQWRLMLQAVVELYDQHPEMFESYHIPKVMAAVIVLKEHNEHPRILDTKEHKRTAWAMIMVLREVWSKARAGTQPPKNNFGGIFE